MIRLLLLLLLSEASATPPPIPSGQRIQGFHRVWVTPDAFADGLGPLGTPPIRPAPEPDRSDLVIFFVLEPQATQEAGLTAATLAAALRNIPDIASVDVNDDGSALKIVLERPRDLNPIPIQTLRDTPIPLGSLGTLEGMPMLRPRLPNGTPPGPRGIEAAPKGNHLMLVNPTSVLVSVRVNGIEVGELKPYATGAIRDVRPGDYAVVYVGPTGFERSDTVATRASPGE